MSPKTQRQQPPSQILGHEADFFTTVSLNVALHITHARRPLLPSRSSTLQMDPATLNLIVHGGNFAACTLLPRKLTVAGKTK